jgi:hypothetical protein
MNQNKTEGFGPLGFIWGRDAGGGSPMGFSGWSPPNAVMYCTCGGLGCEA